MNLILNLPATNFPNPAELVFSVETFYNRVFTVGEITERPRNVYHRWKEEGLIPAHFGRDFWWQYQDIFSLAELAEGGWDKLNFVEACWVKLVDILRHHGCEKKDIVHYAELYFKVTDKQRGHFKTILQQQKEKIRERFIGLAKQEGLVYAKEDINKAFRDIAVEHTYGLFDQLLLSAVYQRQPLIFIASHKGALAPLIEGQSVEGKGKRFVEELLTEPHIVIPFYRIIESMLFEKKFAHFSSPITCLNEVESDLIKSIRDKKIKEINIKKNNEQNELTIRLRESGYIDITDERTLMCLLQKNEYKRVEFTDVDGKKKFFEVEKTKKYKVG